MTDKGPGIRPVPHGGSTFSLGGMIWSLAMARAFQSVRYIREPDAVVFKLGQVPVNCGMYRLTKRRRESATGSAGEASGTRLRRRYWCFVLINGISLVAAGSGRAPRGRLMSNSKRATVYFETDVHRALCLRAATSDRSISNVVNDAVKTLLTEDSGDLAASDAFVQGMKRRGLQ